MTTSSLHAKILSELAQVLDTLSQPQWIQEHLLWCFCKMSSDHPPPLAHLSTPHSVMILEPWEGVCDADVLFRTDYFLLCYFLSFEHLVPELIAIYFKKNLPWWGSRTTTLYWYSNKPLGVSLKVCLFSLVKLFCFLMLMIYLTTGYWPG